MKKYKPQAGIFETFLKIFVILGLGVLFALPYFFSFFSQKNGDLIEFDGPSVLFLQDASNFSENSRFWRGILSFFGKNSKNSQDEGALCEQKSVSAAELESFLGENCGKWDLICADGKEFCAKIERLAKNFPTQKFVFFDAAVRENLPNVAAFSFANEESAFLCGILATQKIKGDGEDDARIALVLPQKEDAKLPQTLGFLQGVLFQMSGARFLFFFGAEEAAKAAFDSDAQIVFAQSRALCEKSEELLKMPRYEKRKMHLVFADEFAGDFIKGNGEAFSVLTRNLVRPEAMAKFALTQAKQGDFQCGNVKLGLSCGAVDFFKNEKALQYSDFSAASKFAGEIVSKKIEVYSNAKTLMSRTFVPDEVAALFLEKPSE